MPHPGIEPSTRQCECRRPVNRTLVINHLPRTPVANCPHRAELSGADHAKVPQLLQCEIGIVTVPSPSHCTTSGSLASAIDSVLTSLPVPYRFQKHPKLLSHPSMFTFPVQTSLPRWRSASGCRSGTSNRQVCRRPRSLRQSCRAYGHDSSMKCKFPGYVVSVMYSRFVTERLGQAYLPAS
jgi:hypothetical protein